MKFFHLILAVFLCLTIIGLFAGISSLIFENEEGFVLRNLTKFRNWVISKKKQTLTTVETRELYDSINPLSRFNAKSDFFSDKYVKMRTSPVSARISTLEANFQNLKLELNNKVTLTPINYDDSLENLTSQDYNWLWQRYSGNNILVNSATPKFETSKLGLNGAIFNFLKTRNGINDSKYWSKLFSLHGDGSEFSIKISEFNNGMVCHCLIPRPEQFESLELDIFKYYIYMFEMYKRVIMFADQITEGKGTLVLAMLASSSKTKSSGSHGIDYKEYALVSKVAALEAISKTKGGLKVVVNTKDS